MISQQYKHELNSLLQNQASALLSHQKGIADAYYKPRTGQLSKALSGRPEVSDLKVSLPYPKHIRFLDLKKGRGGKKKKRYAAIYNRYVYGYLKAPIYRVLMASIPKEMVKVIMKSFKVK